MRPFAAVMTLLFLAVTAPATATATLERSRPNPSKAIAQPLPSVARVTVSFVYAPEGRRSGTVLRISRNRIAFTRTRGGHLRVSTGAPRRGIRLHGRGEKRVQITLDADRRRVAVRAGDRLLSVQRRVVRKGRVIVPGTACCVRGLRILPGARPSTSPAATTPPDGPGATPAAPNGGADSAVDAVSGATVPASVPAAAPAATSAHTLFSGDSVWNKPLAADTPLDPSDAALTGTLRATVAASIAARTGPWIQTTDHSTPLYRVSADQPTVRVTLDAGAWDAPLQSALNAVPIPDGAQPAAGSDGHMTIWQPATGRMWELWRARKAADGWHADYGGAIADTSTSPGYYTPQSWPGAGSHWGATATSLPVIAGTMLIEELRAGVIPHALAISVPVARAGVYSWPAQRTDGRSLDPNAVPEGARFRLDPRLNLDALDMHPVTRMLARAAQRYGMVVRDQTGGTVGFYAEDPTPTGANPYGELFGNQYPTDFLQSFPWDHVQLVQMHLSAA
jgi:hypothetical protein